MGVEDGIWIPYHFWVRLNDAVVVVAVLVEECLEECHGLMPLLIVERVLVRISTILKLRA